MNLSPDPPDEPIDAFLDRLRGEEEYEQWLWAMRAREVADEQQAP